MDPHPVPVATDYADTVVIILGSSYHLDTTTITLNPKPWGPPELHPAACSLESGWIMTACIGATFKENIRILEKKMESIGII